MIHSIPPSSLPEFMIFGFAEDSFIPIPHPRSFFTTVSMIDRACAPGDPAKPARGGVQKGRCGEACRQHPGFRTKDEKTSPSATSASRGARVAREAPGR